MFFANLSEIIARKWGDQGLLESLNRHLSRGRSIRSSSVETKRTWKGDGMQKQLWMRWVVVFLTAALVLTASCSKKTLTATKEPYSELKEEATGTKNTAAKEQETILPEAMSKTGSEDKMAKSLMLEDIYFEFDKSTLTPEARSSLIEMAARLSDNFEEKLIIEGHCDERGTPEYNLALGDRRAESAKDFLADLGISIRRLTTISYGEERPVNPGHNEAAWAKNRRAHFAVK
jgi:peptidoglycan-associated lipoprotein